MERDVPDFGENDRQFGRAMRDDDNTGARAGLMAPNNEHNPMREAGGYSGIDRAMSAHADKLHPVRRR